MRKVLIIGASSAIAEACARRFAAQGDRLFITARQPDRLKALEADLTTRGANRVAGTTLEVGDDDRYPALIDAAIAAMDGLDTVLIAHGSLPDQEACQRSLALTRQELEVNALSIIALLTLLANHFEAQGHGTLAVIASVAGDRGRQSNYVYGTAKAAVATFLEGLRNRLHPAGVRVLTIKPGFVDTPMTAAFPKGPLWASPEQVADGILRALERGRDVVYLPGFWWPIMLLIRHIPEAIFKRLRL